MGLAQINLTIPTKLQKSTVNVFSSELVWYTSVSMETVKLNIYLEKEFTLIYNWPMDYALNWQFCAKWGSLDSFTDTRLPVASPLVGAYKSYSWSIHEYLEIIQIS
jgi:hypothetical protein